MREPQTADGRHQSAVLRFTRNAVAMYVEGFRSMTVGRKLWAIILIKLAVLFLVFRLLLMPDILQRDYDSDEARAAAVRSSLSTSP